MASTLPGVSDITESTSHQRLARISPPLVREADYENQGNAVPGQVLIQGLLAEVGGAGEVDLHCVETIQGEGAGHLRYEVRYRRAA